MQLDSLSAGLRGAVVGKLLEMGSRMGASFFFFLTQICWSLEQLKVRGEG